jgi:hypothetical protein
VVFQMTQAAIQALVAVAKGPRVRVAKVCTEEAAAERRGQMQAAVRITAVAVVVAGITSP